ncbi:ATP-binding protein [Parafrankia sp. FMc2]|uniref:ATP-binding protein n=1 Tax=Parafrankia sp. FMc2 TaxID=3233196 RepID=UPI0034D748DC
MRDSAELAAEADNTLPRRDLPLGAPVPPHACAFAGSPAVTGPGGPAAEPPHSADLMARRTSADLQDLDPREFDRLRRLVGATGGRGDSTLAAMSDEEIARSLGVVVTEAGHTRILAGAVLLFGRPEALRRHVPNHEAAIQVIGPETGDPGTEMNDFFHWPLLRLAEELLARFRARNPEREIRYELVRTGVPAYSEQAFRELLANALVHRDYGVTGAVHVQWTSEGIEISSPGGFAGSGSPGDPPASRTAAPGLLSPPPVPRSPLLADAFRRAGITDRSGRGIRRAHAAQLRSGLAAPDLRRSTADGVVAVLPTQPADLTFALFALGRAAAGSPLELPDLIVLSTALRDRALRTAEVATLFGCDKDRARQHLSGMLARGLMEIGGDRGTRVWLPSAQVRRALREATAQLRARPAPPVPRPGRGPADREPQAPDPEPRAASPG